MYFVSNNTSLSDAGVSEGIAVLETRSTMRRSQSLRSLSGSGGQDRSWVRSSPSLWDYKKSVSQLVQQYQSCVELSSYETDKEKQKVHLSFRSTKEDFSETRVDSPWRRSESWGNHADLMGPGSGSSSLSRSRSMDYLPQRNRTPEGIRALRALFESKAAVPEDRKPRQNEASPASRVELLVAGYQSTEKAQPQGARSSYNTGGTTGQKENTVQRTGESESRRTVSVPESSFREIRAPHPGDRRCLELSYRDSLSRQGRDRNFTSNSEPISYSGKKTKASKFQSPAKEMCSACLTPVYPMEKMVANKLVLHNNCFCCKHCKKKLSICNYSALYGEFYCTFHYEQLFKRKGNYDEGFGHQQHKDRWRPKSKEPEPDNTNYKTKDKKTLKASTGDILGATETTHMPSGDISSVVEAEKIILFAEPDPTSPLNNDMAVSNPASLWSTADDPFDNDIINIGLTVPLSNQTNPDASHLTNQMFIAQEVKDLDEGHLFDLNHDIFGIGDKMTVPDQAWQTEIVATQQDPTKIPHLFDLSTATPTKVLSNQSDVDIFDKDQDATSPVQLSASSMFGQDGADLTLSHPAPSIFSDDILGIGDNSFSGDPQRENPGQVDFNDFDDFIGLDTPAMANAPAAPCQNQSVFAEDIFATEPVMLPSSATTSPAVFIDSFLDAFGGNTEATIVTAPPADDSWLDDFLG
ncbi:hypothetical protein DPEC_G00058510 [Dallia pectoralis]|uniref:Uncharacterized protein n=1 Tax=Dallia pectoralis TaxID=75939 RepID=A0ACC2H6U5_DALPE|nr:hypothetical protein DPEC_G00058510 [Dallia pectoralis]